jgi:hypothetical protein
MKKILVVIISLALFTACDPKVDEMAVTSGSADFSRFVTVGNSMMAGITDAALYNSGQKNSISNIIAEQMKLAGGGNFVQPVINSEYGLEFPGSRPRLVLGYSTDCNGVTSLSPIPYIGTRDPLQPIGYQVNNLGIPGAKSFHFLAPGYGNAAFLVPPVKANPYYVRCCTEPTNPNFMVVNEFAKLNPSFYALWLGDNDVLSYALTGGVGDTITSPGLFQMAMGGVLQTISANGAKGVIGNIPDITTIPFFTTVPYNGIVLTRQSLVDSVNNAMKNLYQLPFTYQLGPNPFLIADPTSSHPLFKVRQMKPGELVLLSVPQDSLKCYGMGIISRINYMPWGIPSQYVLTEDEINNIKTATAAYNQIIGGLAATFQIGLVDLNAKWVTLQKGIVWDGIKMNGTFVTGGAFSLDGVHLTPRGCAVTANYFIDAINAKYGSTIPQANITNYNGVIFP